jgi:hypothetical protein
MFLQTDIAHCHPLTNLKHQYNNYDFISAQMKMKFCHPWPMKELDTDISMNNHHSAALAAGCL